MKKRKNFYNYLKMMMNFKKLNISLEKFFSVENDDNILFKEKIKSLRLRTLAVSSLDCFPLSNFSLLKNK